MSNRRSSGRRSRTINVNPLFMPTNSDSQAVTATLEQRFAGKVALITGASDRGIGGEIAVRLAREGAAVALLSRRVPDRLLKKVNRYPNGAVHTAGDVTNRDDIARAIDDCMGEFGKID